MFKRAVLLVIGLMILATVAVAFPAKMNFQGRLTDTAGNPITTAVDVKFSIFDAASGGVELWTETIVGITPDQGLVNQELGLTTAITSAIFSGDTRYLAVKVGTDAEMAPRIPLAAVPFAFRAATADTVPNNSLTANKFVAGQIVTSVASSGSVTTLKDNIVFEGGSGVTISQNDLLNKITITANSTAGGTVTQINTGTGLTGGPITSSGTVSIANGGVAAGQLATGAVTAGAITDDTITEAKLNVMNAAVNNTVLSYTPTGMAWSAQGSGGDMLKSVYDVANNGRVDYVDNLTIGQVTAGAIASNAIMASSLGTGSVTSGAIAMGTITASNLGTNVVTAGAIANDAITEQKLNMMNAPTTSYTLTYTATGMAWGSPGGTGTVTQVNTGSGLTGGPINTTGTVSIAAGGINATHFGTGVVTAGAIASGNVMTSITSQGSGSLLHDNVALVGGTGITLGQAGQTITVNATGGGGDMFKATYDANLNNKVDYVDNLTIGQVTAGAIAAGAVSANNIGTNVITAGAISTGAITSGAIANNSITASNIGTNAITAAAISMNSVTSGAIANNTITASNIGTNAITAAAISMNSVTSGAIAINSIMASHLGTGVVTAGAIASGNVVTSITSQGSGSLLHDAVALVGGTGITLGQAGQTITVNATGGGGDMYKSTYDVGNNGKVDYVDNLTIGQVTGGAIAAGSVVTRLGTPGVVGLTDVVTLAAGTGITVTQGTGVITISATSSAPDLSGYVKLGPTTVQSTTSAYGINVKTTNASGIGISVETTASGGYGVYGANGSASNGGTGGYFKGGTKSAVGNFSVGVMGRTASGNNYGQLGREAPTAMDNSTDSGVYGYASTLTGHGVYGLADATTGAGNNGGYFEADGDTGTGVYGYGKSSAGGINYGVYGRTDSAGGYGVYGSGTSNGFGVYGYVNAMAMNSIALCGETAGADGYALVTKNGPVSFETSSLDINNTHYSWPGGNPGSESILLNDGDGNLSWSASNDLGFYVKLGPTTRQTTTAAYAINVKTTHASGIGISVETDSRDGAAIMAKNNSTSGVSDYGLAIIGKTSLTDTYGVLGYEDVGVPIYAGVYGQAVDSDSYGIYAKASDSASAAGYFRNLGTNRQAIYAVTEASSGTNYAIYAQSQTANDYAVFASAGNGGTALYGSTSLATANALRTETGRVSFETDRVSINKVSYIWPAANPGSTTVLTNNGAGTLSWSASGVDLSGYVKLGPATGQTTSSAFAVSVESTAAAGTAVSGKVTGTSGKAVAGYATAGGAVTNFGGYFSTAGTNGYGAYGYHIGKSNYGWLGSYTAGAYGYSSGDYGVEGGTATGRGVYGHSSGTGVTYGVYGSVNNAGSTGYAVYGTANGVGSTNGVYGTYDGNNYGYLGANGTGVYGWSGNAGGFGGSFGVEGAGAYGVYASCYATGYGVYGYDNDYDTIGFLGSDNYGAYGKSNTSTIYGGLGYFDGGAYKGAMGVTSRAQGYLGDSAPNGDNYHAGVTGLVVGAYRDTDVAVAAYNEDVGSGASLGGVHSGVYGNHPLMGVSGEAWDTVAVNYGVIGSTMSPNGYGVYGISSDKTIRGGLGVEGSKGVMGETTRARGYLGDSAPNGDNYHAGVTGLVIGSYRDADVAVAAYNEDEGSYASLGGVHSGVYGYNAVIGVSGEAFNTTGLNYGGIFTSRSSSGYGVYGQATTTSGKNYGVYGVTNSPSGYGLEVHNASNTYSAGTGGVGAFFEGGYFATGGLFNYKSKAARMENRAGTTVIDFCVDWNKGDATYSYKGISLESSISGAIGIDSLVSSTSSQIGVRGLSMGVSGAGVAGANLSTTVVSANYGVYGSVSSSNNAAYGVYGEAARTSTYGILGNDIFGAGGTYNNATGPYGWLGTATAGVFAYAASPAWALNTNGRVHMTNLSPAGAGTALVISGTGEVYPQSSSRRYKKDIVDLNIDPSKVSQLRPVRFRWKETTATPNEPDFGLIAEEVNEVYPDLVRYNQNGSPEGVAYDKIGVILIKAFQSKAKELETVKIQLSSLEAEKGVLVKEIDSLKEKAAKNQELEARLKALEDKIK